MILETKGKFQMLAFIGAGPYEDTLYCILNTETRETVSEGNKLWIDRVWSKL